MHVERVFGAFGIAYDLAGQIDRDFSADIRMQLLDTGAKFFAQHDRQYAVLQTVGIKNFPETGCETTVVQDAWARGQQVCVHGWVYSLSTGLVNDLGVTVGGLDDLAKLDDPART